MSDLATLNKQLADYDLLIARRDKFAKLMQNKLFQELIVEDFINEETVRNATMAGDPNHFADKDYSLNAAMAGGHLKRYINLSVQLGDMAERDRPATVEMIQEIMSEDHNAHVEDDDEDDQGQEYLN